jgi:NDP-sugar pyrophosphorylase family protein
MSLETTDAFILVGGLGTRLRPVLGSTPKALAPVLGRPFLHFLLTHLELQGICRVILLVGFGADALHKAIGYKFRSLSVEYSIEVEPRGTAGALRHALHLSNSSRLLLLNGDSLCVGKLAPLVTHTTHAIMMTTFVPDVSRFGEVRCNESSQVFAFTEKDHCARPGFINAGIYCFPRELVADFSTAIPYSLEHSVLPELVRTGNLYAHPGGPFLDIGVPQSYALAEAFIREHLHAVTL